MRRDRSRWKTDAARRTGAAALLALACVAQLCEALERVRVNGGSRGKPAARAPSG